jgi:tRNA pseudouridine38-40 synthase
MPAFTPADINILDAVVVPHRFHARHDAVARRYVYQIARRRTAFHKATVWWVREPLDVDRMRAAAAAFVGRRDFKSFAEDDGKNNPGGRSTEVQIDRLEIVDDEDLLLIVVEGSHFLWKMVRRVVGVLVEIGRGRVDASSAEKYLSEESDAPAKLTAPGSGLFLARVYYKGDARETHVRALTPLPRPGK